MTQLTNQQIYEEMHPIFMVDHSGASDTDSMGR